MTFPITSNELNAAVTFRSLPVKRMLGVQHYNGLNAHQQHGTVKVAPLLVKSIPGLHSWINTTPNIESIQPPTIGQIWPRGNRFDPD